MKNFFLFLSLMVAMVLSTTLYGQTTNTIDVTALRDSLETEFQRQKEEAFRLAEQLNLPTRLIGDDGSVSELMRFQNGMPVYYSTRNADGAEMIMSNELYSGGTAGLDLSGSGQILGVWDGGLVLATHQELSGRVTHMNPGSDVITHATHVAGTMAAEGVNADAKGMAYQSNIHSYDWNNDDAEMLNAAANGLIVSQHSYGAIAGWAEGNFSGTFGWHWFGDVSISEDEDYRFGFYDVTAQTWDLVAQSSPYYLIVRSAGNDRGFGPDPGTEHFYFDAMAGEWVISTTTRQADGGADGYDCISYTALAKNILTVGSVNQAGNISAFSAWGPTDDGRIKPDIVAKGQPVFSSMAESDSSYSFMAGTSMSGPMVSGSIGLLLEHQQNLQAGQNLLSSTLKALVIHSADDEIGGAPGPDYRYGWGLMNTKKAAEVMSNNANADGAVIVESSLSENDTVTIQLIPTGTEPLRATLVWTDMPGPLPTPALNPTDIILVNDLDMRIQDEDDLEFFPYILDPSNPQLDASTGDNFRDNVEMIHIDDPDPSGVYTLKIHHKANLESGNQAFSLVVSGANVTGIPDWDISVEAILNPTDNICGEVFVPTVTIKNHGKQILESATIFFHLNDETPDSIVWNGSLAPLQFVNVDLPEMSASTGPNSFTAFTSKPNGFDDENPANDTMEVAFFANGEVIFVNQAASGMDNGLSWDDAFVYLQDALEIACSCPTGAQIWVAEGNYFPDDGANQTPDDRNASFFLCSGVEIYGGFNGTESSLEDRDWIENETILNGDINQSNSLTDNSFTIVHGFGIDSTAILDGFFVNFGFASGGGASPNPNFRGAGLYLNNASPTIRNAHFINNAAGFGGAVYAINSQPTFNNVTFDDNFANVAGGAIYALSSNLEIKHCSFVDNFANAAGGAILNEQTPGSIYATTFLSNAANLGGAIYNASSSPDLFRCQFSGNLAGVGGGAVYNFNSSSPEIKSCLFSGNAADRGAGIYNEDNSSPNIVNSTFSGNDAGIDGGALFNELSSNPVLANCIIWHNGVGGSTSVASSSIFNTSGSEPEFSYSIVAHSNGSGPIWNADFGLDSGEVYDFNPEFIEVLNPSNAPSVSGNFQLTECSEAIDAGNNLALTASDSLDLNGDTRFFNATQVLSSIVDFGAYEFQSTVPTPELSCPDISIYLEDEFPLSIAVEELYSLAAECPDWDLILPEVDSLNFSCSSIGDSLVTIVVSNLTGSLSDTCISQISILDTLPPVAVCQDITVELGTDGLGSVSASEVDNGSSDNCGALSLSLDQTDFVCDDIGIQQVILSVEDGSGNMASCSANVTVVDNLSPVAVCQDIAVELGTDGLGSVSASEVDNGSSDNCGAMSLSLDQTDFDCDDIGIQPVILTVEDGSGNMASCSASVTVEDNLPPVAVCQDITVELGTNGLGSVSASEVDNGSSDNCGAMSLSLDQTDFDCDDIGIQQVILSVEDGSGNMASCSANVTVQDNLSPVAVCQDITVELGTDGLGSVSASEVDNGSSDNCGALSLSLDQTDFDCDDIGIQPVILTVEDGSGNMASCSANVTVEDNLSPVAVCQDVTVELGTDGLGSVSASEVDNGSSDNCGALSLSLDQTDFDCDDIGIQQVILSVEDGSGNMASCSANVTVEDNLSPVAVCQDITVELGTDGLGSISASEVDNGSSDNCGTLSLSLDQTDFDCDDIGIQPVILSVEDGSGNMASCSANVTVEDNLSPVAVCQDVTVELGTDGLGIVSASEVDNGSSDNCGALSLSLDQTDFDCDDIGIQPVILTVEDGSGNMASCSANVTVEDNLSPVAVCQDITVELGTDGLGSVSASEVDNGSSDNCGALSLSLDQTDFDCDDIGVQQVILSVEDGSGNMASCISSVEVVDLLEPDLDCAISVSQQVENPGDSSVFAAIPIALASDNCGVIDIVNNYNAGGADASDIYSLGSTLVVYLAEDGNGNTESCTTEVIVFADSSVVAVCQNISVGLDSMGTLVVTGAEIDGGSFGGEGELTFFINGNTVLEFDCDDQGTIGVTLLVVDELGEEDDCTAEITIVDNISPVALCTNIELGLNEDGLASIIPEDIDAGSFDNCAIEGLEASQVSFDCDHIGGNHVELTVFDENGNSSSCSATVTIVDDVPPVLDCQDHELSLSIDGEASLTIADVLVMASDNCGIESFELSQSTFECTDIGENLVFLTASDDSGNTSTCEVEVVVFDDIPPAMNCTPMISQQVETPGDSTVFVSVMLVSATDNCIEVTVENNIGPGGEDASSIFFLGETEVVFIGTDGSGNQSSCTTIVNVIEDLTLVAVCSDLTIQLDEDGSAVLEADQLDGGSFGGIGELSFQINGGSEIAFDCSDIGLLSLTMVVSDEESNQDSCSSIVEIVDDLNPIALCQDITLYLNSSGNADLTVEEVDGGSSDNCEIVSYVLDQSNFNCDHLGENAVSLLVADGSGNTSSCVSEVTVFDTIFPDISCPEDITLEIAEGESEAFVSLEEAMASDNCEILNIENNYNSNGEDASDIYELGQTVVVFTATDQSGNITECQTVVLVIPENIPSDEYQIGGNISTDFGVNINLVEMKVSGDESFSEFSDTDGNYSLTVQSGSEVTVAPEKNTNWLDGVTTLDLILIQRHLLGLELFDSPYKIIAADANDDGLVSTFDLVLLQILIIGNSDSLAGNTSWRFIPAEFEFADPGNPLAEFFPEFKEYPPLSQDWEEEDWVAIKVGDVSGDAGLSGMRISRATADFELNHQSDAGTHHLVLTAAEDMNLSGFQMEWSVSEDIYIERVDMQYSILPRLNVDFYNFDTQTNLLKVNWWSADAQTVSKGDEIFRLELIGEVDPMVAISALSLVSAGSLWQSEIYLNSSSGLEIRHPRLIAVKFSERKTQNKLFQNEPNPFDQLTAIPFFTVEEGPVKLEIFDRSGLEIKSIDISALAGMNRFYLDLSSLPGGVYFYRLSSKNGDWRESLRMIKVEK